jgi:hypothetical protein
MALDFPNAPTVNQKWPQPPIGGVPVYTWDGTKWTTVSAPISGKTPVYTDGSNVMSAALTLSGDPVNPTDAADKNYVDNRPAGPGGVRYDIVQSLSSPQQMQARTNIGSGGSPATRTRTVLYTPLGSSGTYTTPANCKAINVRLVGGGGGGGGSSNGTSGGIGGNGGATTFGPFGAGGGLGAGNAAQGGLGGGPTGTVDLGIGGGIGNGSATTSTGAMGGMGGSSVFGGGGGGGASGNPGQPGGSYSGGGGGGGGSTVNWSGAGGGAGGYAEKLIVNPAASYAYALGAPGVAGAAGTGGWAGGQGAAGIIIVDEFY